MKHIQNFSVNSQPDGNELKWVGTVSNDSRFELLRSSEGLDFETIHTMTLSAHESEVFEYFDADAPKGKVFYQVVYWVNKKQVQESPVIRIDNEKKHIKWLGLMGKILVALVLIMVTRALVKKITAPKGNEPVRITLPNTSAVKVAEVAYSNFNTSVEALGQVISTQPIDIVSEVSGRILKGDVVLRKANKFEKGALLFAIEKEEAILNLKSQRSNFQNAIALMLADLKLDFPNEFDKWNAYFQALSEEKTLAALPSIANEREKTFVATRNVLGQYYTIKSAEERLKKYEVRAPYSGIITEVYTDAGSVANTGVRVIRVMRTDQLELELPIQKEDMQWIKMGTIVKLFSEDRQQTTTGRIARVSNTLDPSTQSINVYVALNPGKIKLYEGMYLVAELSGRVIGSAMEMDRKAVFDKNKVFVMLSDSTLQEKTIKVHKLNTETVIFSGLVAGEKVVNDNLLGLTDGVKIVPLK